MYNEALNYLAHHAIGLRPENLPSIIDNFLTKQFGYSSFENVYRLTPVSEITAALNSAINTLAASGAPTHGLGEAVHATHWQRVNTLSPPQSHPGAQQGMWTHPTVPTYPMYNMGYVHPHWPTMMMGPAVPPMFPVGVSHTGHQQHPAGIYNNAQRTPVAMSSHAVGSGNSNVSDATFRTDSNAPHVSAGQQLVQPHVHTPGQRIVDQHSSIASGAFPGGAPLSALSPGPGSTRNEQVTVSAMGTHRDQDISGAKEPDSNAPGTYVLPTDRQFSMAEPTVARAPVPVGRDPSQTFPPVKLTRQSDCVSASANEIGNTAPKARTEKARKTAVDPPAASMTDDQQIYAQYEKGKTYTGGRAQRTDVTLLGTSPCKTPNETVPKGDAGDSSPDVSCDDGGPQLDGSVGTISEADRSVDDDSNNVDELMRYSTDGSDCKPPAKTVTTDGSKANRTHVSAAKDKEDSSMDDSNVLYNASLVRRAKKTKQKTPSTPTELAKTTTGVDEAKATDETATVYSIDEASATRSGLQYKQSPSSTAASVTADAVQQKTNRDDGGAVTRSRSTNQKPKAAYEKLVGSIEYDSILDIQNAIKTYRSHLTCGGGLRRRKYQGQGASLPFVFKYTCTCNKKFHFRVTKVERTLPVGVKPNQETRTQQFIIQVPTGDGMSHVNGSTLEAVLLNKRAGKDSSPSIPFVFDDAHRVEMKRRLLGDGSAIGQPAKIRTMLLDRDNGSNLFADMVQTEENKRKLFRAIIHQRKTLMNMTDAERKKLVVRYQQQTPEHGSTKQSDMRQDESNSAGKPVAGGIQGKRNHPDPVKDSSNKRHRVSKVLECEVIDQTTPKQRELLRLTKEGGRQATKMSAIQREAKRQLHAKEQVEVEVERPASSPPATPVASQADKPSPPPPAAEPSTKPTTPTDKAPVTKTKLTRRRKRMATSTTTSGATSPTKTKQARKEKSDKATDEIPTPLPNFSPQKQHANSGTGHDLLDRPTETEQQLSDSISKLADTKSPSPQPPTNRPDMITVAALPEPIDGVAPSTLSDDNDNDNQNNNTDDTVSPPANAKDDNNYDDSPSIIKEVNTAIDSNTPKEQNQPLSQEPWQLFAFTKHSECAASVMKTIVEETTPKGRFCKKTMASIIAESHAPNCSDCILTKKRPAQPIGIGVNDLVRLDGVNWLNDLVIEKALDLIKQHFGGAAQHVQFMSAYWFRSMFKSLDDGTTSNEKNSKMEYTEEAFQKGTKGVSARFNRRSRNEDTNYRDKEIAFIPINELDHWLWILVVKTSKTILVCDPMGTHTEERVAYLGFLAKCVETRLKNDLKRLYVREHSNASVNDKQDYNVVFPFGEERHQADGGSCGAYLIWAAWSIASDKDIVGDVSQGHRMQMTLSTVSLRHKHNTANKIAAATSMQRFRRWIFASILMRKLWYPPPKELKNVQETQNKTKAITCANCNQIFARENWKTTRPVSLGCKHHMCGDCFTRFNVPPVPGEHAGSEFIWHKPCPLCRSIGDWTDMYTNTPCPEHRMYGYQHITTVQKGRWKTKRVHPQFKEIYNVKTCNKLYKQMPLSKSNTYPHVNVIGYGSGQMPINIERGAYSRLCSIIKDECVWCGEKPDMTNTACKHRGCLRCYERLTDPDKLSWTVTELDVLLLRVTHCPVCNKHNGCWATESTDENDVRAADPVYGFYRKIEQQPQPECLEDDDDLPKFEETVKKIQNKEEWNQLCLHFTLLPWMTGNTKTNKAILDRAKDFTKVSRPP